MKTFWIIGLLVALSSTSVFALNDSGPVFSEDYLNEKSGVQDGTIRQRSASVQIGVIANPGKEVSLNVQLNFFENANFQVDLDSSTLRSDESFTWFGKVSGKTASYAQVTCEGESCLIHVTSPDGRSYRATLNGKAALIEELDPKAFKCGTDDLSVRPPLQKANEPKGEAHVPTTTAFDDGSVVDVLVVYTPAVRTAAGSADALMTLIHSGFDAANVSLRNSLVDGQFRLVHAAQVTYTETNNTLEDIENLGTGRIPGALEMMDLYKADLVTLIANTGDAGGRGALCANTVQRFSVVQRLYFGTFTAAHEWGHNMGCHHDRANADQEWICYDFGYGQAFVGKSGVQWGTIMSYVGSRTPLFSNPDVTFDGVPVGIPSTMPNSANNAEVLRRQFYTIANLSVSSDGPPTPSPTPSPSPTAITASNCYYRGVEIRPYASLQGGTVIWNGATDIIDDELRTLSIPFPFTFYGQTQTQVRVSSNGYLTFNTTENRSNAAIPSATTPNNLIAAWWDDLIIWNFNQVGRVSYKLEGMAPNRSLIVEYGNVSPFFFGETDLFVATFSVRLLESGNRIEVHYGPSSVSGAPFIVTASSGIENSDGSRGTTGLPGSPYLSYSDFPESGYLISYVPCVIATPSPTPTATPAFTPSETPSPAPSPTPFVPEACYEVEIGQRAYFEFPGATVWDQNSPAIYHSTQEIPLPFNFKFYDHEYSKVEISGNGYLAFGPSVTWHNVGIPNDVAPNALLAGWWDMLILGGGFSGRVAYRTTGTAPNRKFTVQYSNIGSIFSSPAAYALLNFQISIQETSGQIEFAYGPIQVHGDPRHFSATLGIESPDGQSGIQPFPRSPHLDYFQFPENGCVITFKRCPDQTPSPTPTSTPSLSPSPTFAPGERLEKIRMYILGHINNGAGLDANLDGNVDIGDLLSELD